MISEKLKVASEAGLARAAQMIPGTKFVGSAAEAVAAGYIKGTAECHAFQVAFLGALAQPVIVNSEGVIVATADR